MRMSVLNPQSSILNPQSSILNPQSLILNLSIQLYRIYRIRPINRTTIAQIHVVLLDPHLFYSCIITPN